MRPLIQEIQTAHTPESLVENLHGENGIILLRSNSFDSPRPVIPSSPQIRF